jgi:hypothetical protein
MHESCSETSHLLAQVSEVALMDFYTRYVCVCVCVCVCVRERERERERIDSTFIEVVTYVWIYILFY